MAQWTQTGTVWQVDLSHGEVNEISGNVGGAGGIASAAGHPEVGAVLGAIAGVLVTVDLIGGQNGVRVVGVFFTQFVTVTPAFVSPIGLVTSFAHALQQATGLPGSVVGAGIGAGVALLALGPAGVVLGGVTGWVGTIGGGGGGGGWHPGDVVADRRAVGPWEKFLLVTLTPNHVAMSSWRGYFSAEDGGGNAVHANRNAIGPWETATLIRNPNNTVSLQAVGGHYLTAETGGGRECNWNRTAIGPWEQFWMEFQPDGTFALKTFSQGTYVSVQ